MQFFRLITHLIKSVWKNTTPLQAALITALFVVIVLIFIVSVVQILVPFTYIAI